MLIDDNNIDNFFHERVIKKHDDAINVVCYQSAIDALEYLKKPGIENPDLIFLDINMPGMDGWEFLDNYSQLPEISKKSMVVVMLSTSENPDDIDKARGTGILHDFKTKPLTREMMADIAVNYVNRNA